MRSTLTTKAGAFPQQMSPRMAKPLSSDGKLNLGQGNGGLCARFVYLFVAALTFCLALAAMSECRFYVYEPEEPTLGIEDDRLINVTRAEIGIYRFNPNDEGCREIPDDLDYHATYKAVRVGAAFSILWSAISIAMVLIELVFCRFICSQQLIGGFFFSAAAFQSMTVLVYASPVCNPNIENGPYPCSPSKGTWFSVSATVLFVLLSVTTCCLPQPVPISRRLQFESTTDPCPCTLCSKKPAEKDENELEEQDEEAVEGLEENIDALGVSGLSYNASMMIPPYESTVITPKMSPQTTIQPTLEERKAAVEITTALVQVRRDKQEEIEKQLALLTLYKDELPEEVYHERVNNLMLALPDPSTYDAYTHASVLVGDGVAAGNVHTDKKDEDPDGLPAESNKDADQEVEVELKKSRGSKIASTVSSTISSLRSRGKGSVKSSGVQSSHVQVKSITGGGFSTGLN